MSSFENKVATQIGQLQLNIFQLQTQLEAKNAVLIDVQKKAAEKEKHMTEAYEEAIAEHAGLKNTIAELGETLKLALACENDEAGWRSTAEKQLFELDLLFTVDPPSAPDAPAVDLGPGH